ncbi:MAG: hypothetical protein CME62_04770 [Halobacteriovoraceae bacterium]|nr:hypothetical protein [Halobacteriovoraceae bacterium]|tara:strand:+ start:4971 stop:5663 length:693 start_codon:yes stop_codon:yes gene_type:complete
MAILTLVPTPIANDLPLCPATLAMIQRGLENDGIFAVEEHKAARRRWISFGLPRETIDEFILYNEHTYEQASQALLSELKKGRDVYLMSDCGMPAFCDPGRKLVSLCHNAGIKVTATPFANSVVLALALSGFEHKRFLFEGFIPLDKKERRATLQKSLQSKTTIVLMDTPYRLKKLMGELQELNTNRSIFLACDLNKENELLLRGSVDQVFKKLPDEKKEFVMIIGDRNE